MAAPALRSCATCGYLSLLNRSNEQHEEATVENRQRGLFKRDTCIHRARCSKGVRDLPSESLEAVRRLSTDRDSDNTRPDAILDTINKPRSESECRLWTPHFPNHTPKDHDQMMWQQMAMDAKERSADALARSADSQSRLADVQQKLADIYIEMSTWKKDQDKDNAKWQSEQEKKTDKSNRRNLVIALIALAISLASPFIERGMLFPDVTQSPNPVPTTAPK